MFKLLIWNIRKNKILLIVSKSIKINLTEKSIYFSKKYLKNVKKYFLKRNSNFLLNALYPIGQLIIDHQALIVKAKTIIVKNRTPII